MTSENEDEPSAGTSGTGMYKVLSIASFMICGFLYRLPVLWIRIRSCWIQNFWLGPDPEKSFCIWAAPDPK